MKQDFPNFFKSLPHNDGGKALIRHLEKSFERDLRRAMEKSDSHQKFLRGNDTDE